MEYFRVELYDMNKGCTIGGFVSCVTAMIARKMNIRPDIPRDELAEIIASSSDQDVKNMSGAVGYILEDVAFPEIYVSDKMNHFCFFNPRDFADREIFFEVLSDYVDEFLPGCELVYCIMEFDPEEILYKDEHQIVVSKAVYEAHKPTAYYRFNVEW